MPSSDSFNRRVLSQSGPANRFTAINPSDTAALPFLTAAIYVGGAGDLSVVDAISGATVVFKALPVGMILPIETNRVNATATTATNLVALG